ncbi:Dyp-type peroxidase [Streptomyces sp. MAR4 CNX-425]|uniref:Dyp-type peroxidase n=1 Tax=Streptomyces sp. MAR4 CNX-425 TaxID=3406343 RepID=UPI003B502EA0
MPEPQPVLAPPATAAVFLVVTVAPGGEKAVRDVLADLPALQRAVGFGAPDDRLTCVAGIGATVWGRLFQGPRPAGLHPFRELAGARHRAVATPGDVLFHVRSRRMDLCFELARRLCAELGDAVEVADEVHGFKYYDMRDLLGFVDGTENPEGRAAGAAVFTGAEDPRFAGGAYVMVQKYLHDLDAWEALSTEEQERVIGRTKLGNTELPEGVQPDDSHVALNTVTGADGEEREVVRDNMPFGSVGEGEFGTYFIGYAREPGVLEEMLENMFLGRPPAAYDRILDFSTAVTGCLFFAPAAGFLDDLPDLPTALGPAATAGPDPVPDPPAAGDGSLGIGGLEGATAR